MTLLQRSSFKCIVSTHWCQWCRTGSLFAAHICPPPLGLGPDPPWRCWCSPWPVPARVAPHAHKQTGHPGLQLVKTEEMGEDESEGVLKIKGRESVRRSEDKAKKKTQHVEILNYIAYSGTCHMWVKDEEICSCSHKYKIQICYSWSYSNFYFFVDFASPRHSFSLFSYCHLHFICQCAFIFTFPACNTLKKKMNVKRPNIVPANLP